MKLPNNIEYVRYWTYFPAEAQRTKPRITRRRELTSQIKSALHEPMRRLEYYAEDPTRPRHILVVYPGDRTSMGFKVMGDVVTVGKDCYEARTGRLRKVLESLPSSGRETLRRRGKPCFRDD